MIGIKKKHTGRPRELETTPIIRYTRKVNKYQQYYLRGIITKKEYDDFVRKFKIEKYEEILQELKEELRRMVENG